MEKILLNVEEAAEVLGVGKSTVYDLIRMRLLRSVRIGKSRRVPVEACRELVDRLLEQEPVA
jgi:excisionase family DNA binding protein